MLRPCDSQLSREQRSPMSKPSKKPRPPVSAPSGRLKPLALWPTGMSRPGGPLRPSHSTGNMAKPSETWRNKSSERKAEGKLTYSPPVRLPYMPVELKGMLVASYHNLLGQVPTSHPFTLSQEASPAEQQSAPVAPHTPAPKQSPRPKRWHPSPDPMDSMPLGGTISKATSEGPPSSKWWEVPPWNKVLKQSCSEVFSQDTDLVKEARKQYFKRHSYNFTEDGTHNLSEVFKQMAKSTDLLGTAIHENQVVLMGPDELRQANYSLKSLPKGLEFLQAVPQSESLKIMGLVEIHDLHALCHFNSLTHCPWCGKEGKNERTVINHLQTVHYRLGLVCNKCNDCPSTTLDTLHCHGQQNCQQPGEKNPNEIGFIRVVTHQETGKNNLS